VQNVYKSDFLPTTANFLDDNLEKKPHLPVPIKKKMYPPLRVVVNEEKAWKS